MSRSLIAIALIAAAGAIASVAIASRDYVVSAVHRAWDFVLDSFAPLARVQPKAPSDLNPIALLVAAKAFMQRLAKRDRPRVTPMWRMCPSI